jgi:hypothetical protein
MLTEQASWGGGDWHLWSSQLLMDRLSIRPKAWRNGHVWESSEQDKKGLQVHRGE